jgi:DNA-binding CsgD family transcriptional regulator
VLAASHERATQRELADRFGISTHRVRSIVKRYDLSGGPPVRQLRAQPTRLRELELTARQREVIDLVVAQRVSRADAAERLGVSPTTVAADLKAASIRLQDADGTENAADT